MTQPTLLLMTGAMGAGKSVGADFYVEHRGASRWSRTELMKRLAHALADGVGDPDAILVRIFDDGDDRAEVGHDLLAYIETYEPEFGKPRRLYQDITQICQDRDPLCFEREMAQRIAEAGDAQFCLIDDVRSAASFEFFTGLGYRSIRIDAAEHVRRRRMKERDGYLPSEETFRHPSEIELNDITHDYRIDNNEDDPARLYRRLDDILVEISGLALPDVDYETIAAEVMARLAAKRAS
jgi:hypothetical protein